MKKWLGRNGTAKTEKAKRGSLRKETINEEGAYILHLDKSKGERVRETNRNRREKEKEVIEESCDDNIHSKARRISQRDETNQETGAGGE